MIKNLTKGLNWIPFIFGAGIVLELLLVLLGKGSGLGDLSNILVMAAFFVVAGGIYFLSYRYLAVGRKIQKNLETAAVDIEALGTDSQDILEELLSREKVFTDSRLNDAFREFKSELESIEQVGKGDAFNIDTKVNIQDYINEELIDSAIQANFLGQIPSTLTGIGILGTFLGLSISLNSFDLTGSAANVEANIGPLMDGIKVAFHTSICGLCFSIMYNFFYHKTRSEIIKSLDYFLEIFQREVVPSTDNGSANTFLKYQAMICKELDQQIVLENAIMEKQDNRFAGLAEKLDEQNKQTLDIYRQISEMISEKQINGIQRVVDSFVRQMNKALGNSFTDIQSMVQDMRQHEKELQDTMSESLGRVCNMSESMAEMNAGLEHSVQRLEAFMKDTGTMQKLLSDNLAEAHSIQELESHEMKRQAELMEKLGLLEEKIGRTAEAQYQRISDIFLAQENKLNLALDGFTETMQGTITGISENMQSTIAGISKNMQDTFAGISGNVQGTFVGISENVQDTFAGISENVQGTLSDISKNMQDDFTGISENVQGTLSDISKNMQNTITGISEIAAHMADSQEKHANDIDGIVKDIGRHTKTYMTETQSAVSQLTQNVEAGIKSVDELVRSLNQEMEAGKQKRTQETGKQKKYN